MTDAKTELVRCYADDKTWLMQHRGTGNTADAIQKTIHKLEKIEQIIQGAK